MTLDNADDVGWAVIKAFCEQQIDDMDADSGFDYPAGHERRAAFQDVIEFIEANAP